MEYIAYFTVIIVTLALCFLVDTLFKRHRKKKGNPNQVKPNKRSAAFGIILCFLALAIGFNFLDTWYMVLGAIVVLAMGAFLLVVYGCTAIVYDEDGFTYKTPLHKAKTYCYADITGQNALLTRSGVNSMLLVGDSEIHIYESMEGVNDFLKTAYHGWLQAKGMTEAECPPPNPTYLVWFPEPENGG